MDINGLVYKGRTSGTMDKGKELYAHPWDKGDIIQIDQVVDAVQATAIFGVSGVSKIFTEKVCKKVQKYNNRPIIFPMSNPTSQSECTAEQAYAWTNNQCIFASGSPFPKIVVSGKEIVPAQSNNAYIFPGVAFGIISSKSSRVSENMFLKSAETLASLVTEEMLDKGVVYPPLENIRDVSLEIAIAVAEEAYKQGYATQVEAEDIRQLITFCRYDHKHQRFYHDNCFDSLAEQFGNDSVPANEKHK